MPDSTPRRGPAAARPMSSAPSSQKGPPSAKPGFAAKPGIAGKPDKPEHEILFQKYFKSVGPRTYAAQVKRATNGNHYLVLTEGKRDDATGEVRKTRLFIFGEDFSEFFRMLHETAQFIRANPVPEEVKKKRQRFWAKKSDSAGGATSAPRRSFQPAPSAAPFNGNGNGKRSDTKSPTAPPPAAASRPRPKPGGQRGR